MHQNRQFPEQLGTDHLKWLSFQVAQHDIGKRHGARQRATARRLLRGLFGHDPVSGMILGDEVGMGKTYETFGVMAALLRHASHARIVVLAHSAPMARTWLNRWDAFHKHNVAPMYRHTMPDGSLMLRPSDIGRPGVLFGSYETFKRASQYNLRAMLEWMFAGSGLHESTRKDLRWELFGFRAPGSDLPYSMQVPPIGIRKRYMKSHYDPCCHGWKSGREALNELRRLVLRATRTKRQVDLLVVDEAHKVAEGQREMFFSEVMDGRARRALYVTATPFAMHADDLVDLIRDMCDATGTPVETLRSLQQAITAFRNAIEAPEEYSDAKKRRVQLELGHYLVRSCWPDWLRGKSGKRRRNYKRLPHDASGGLTEEMAFATLALETAFLRLRDSKQRVHRAAHRETLCSSYSAIREAIKKRTGKDGLPRYLIGLHDLLPKQRESPKFDRAFSYLLEKAKAREKVVVFCKRLATVARMRRQLHRALAEERDEAATKWSNLQKKFSLRRRRGNVDAGDVGSEAMALARLALFMGKNPTLPLAAGLHRQLAHHTQRAEPDIETRITLLEETWGHRRHADWVAELSGRTRSEDGRGKSQEAVRFSFNLPGPPYILLCTHVAREGIDLHHWCRHVMQYDLEWNPAFMEQQIGRVDRIGSFASRKKKQIEVLYVHQPKTYEERIADVVRERCEMLRVLLGAGQWLAETPEQQARVTRLEQYRLDFSP